MQAANKVFGVLIIAFVLCLCIDIASLQKENAKLREQLEYITGEDTDEYMKGVGE